MTIHFWRACRELPLHLSVDTRGYVRSTDRYIPQCVRSCWRFHAQNLYSSGLMNKSMILFSKFHKQKNLGRIKGIGSDYICLGSLCRLWWWSERWTTCKKSAFAISSFTESRVTTQACDGAMKSLRSAIFKAPENPIVVWRRVMCHLGAHRVMLYRLSIKITAFKPLLLILPVLQSSQSLMMYSDPARQSTRNSCSNTSI